MASLTKYRVTLIAFVLIDSKKSKTIDTMMSASNENLCLVSFLKKADRIAIEKSSRLVSIIHH